MDFSSQAGGGFFQSRLSRSDLIFVPLCHAVRRGSQPIASPTCREDECGSKRGAEIKYHPAQEAVFFFFLRVSGLAYLSGQPPITHRRAFKDKERF